MLDTLVVVNMAKKENRQKVLNDAIEMARQLEKLMKTDECIAYEVRKILMEDRCDKCWSLAGEGQCWSCFESDPYNDT